MIVKLLKRGRSFKGAWQYHFHDKRPGPNHPHPVTDERVLYRGTRNLATQNPETAWKMMAFTCQIAPYLKEQAGLSNRGKKCTRPVLPVLISYGKGQNPAFNETECDIDEVLGILGVSDHEAVWAVHDDTANRHIHLLVNTVHPVTGKAAQFGKDHALALQDWAGRKEREHGIIQCHNRESANKSPPARKQSHAERKARQLLGNDPQAVALAGRLSEDLRAEWAALYAEKRRIEQAHKENLKDIYAESRKSRAKIKSTAAAMIRSVYKYDHSPLLFTPGWFRQQEWKRLARRITAARRLFRSRERSAGGRLLNAAMLALSDFSEKAGFVDYLLNRELRAAHLERWIDHEWRKLRERQNILKKGRVSRIRQNEHKAHAEIAEITQSRITAEEKNHAGALKAMQAQMKGLSETARQRWEACGRKGSGPELQRGYSAQDYSLK